MESFQKLGHNLFHGTVIFSLFEKVSLGVMQFFSHIISTWNSKYNINRFDSIECKERRNNGKSKKKSSVFPFLYCFIFWYVFKERNWLDLNGKWRRTSIYILQFIWGCHEWKYYYIFSCIIQFQINLW